MCSRGHCSGAAAGWTRQDRRGQGATEAGRWRTRGRGALSAGGGVSSPRAQFWMRGYRHLPRQNSEWDNILVALPSFLLLLSPSPSQAQICAQPTCLVSHYISSVLCGHSPSPFLIFRRASPAQPLLSNLSVAS
ncbi:hypothetical protein BD309DRAFT_767781 [Dichomitus squalens]|uniref:Uncharacterized protein n=1 Tax=Dichomitus squalens TaxID=114155 RepID=A0A4Q9NX28_9APHY|nr:hypothetical protein BD309DRAFT_767781 [Dichomitus squalens]TBU64207.1 hypothetical protein BD310DRAFT_472367 [Dichomitus squalens]